MNYGPTSQLIRGHSELLLCDLNSLNGVPRPNALGVEYQLPIARYADRKVMEIRCVTNEYLKGKGLPSFADTQRLLLTMKTPEGDAFIKDLPLSRISVFNPGIGRGFMVKNLVWEPRYIDAQQCNIYSVGVPYPGIVALELVYLT